MAKNLLYFFDRREYSMKILKVGAYFSVITPEAVDRGYSSSLSSSLSNSFSIWHILLPSSPICVVERSLSISSRVIGSTEGLKAFTVGDKSSLFFAGRWCCEDTVRGKTLVQKATSRSRKTSYRKLLLLRRKYGVFPRTKCREQTREKRYVKQIKKIMKMIGSWQPLVWHGLAADQTGVRKAKEVLQKQKAAPGSSRMNNRSH